MNAVNALWSPQQQQWLKALGHTVYVQGTIAIDVAKEVAPYREPPAMLTAAPQRRRPEPAAVAPIRVAEAPVRRPASRLPDKLHFALIRASGCNPNAGNAAEVFAQWPPSSELRGNPAAKRALWPQLRALRRQSMP
ncbi:MAG TPA: alanine acetyltransferase [Pseudoxanthomonas sp.]